MKNIKSQFFLITLLIISFISCKDDPEPTPEPEVPETSLTPYSDLTGTYRNVNVNAVDIAFFFEYDAEKQKLLFFPDYSEESFIPEVTDNGNGSYLLTGQYKNGFGETGQYTVTVKDGKLTLKSDHSDNEIVAVRKSSETDFGYAIEGNYPGSIKTTDGERLPAFATIERIAKDKVSVKIEDAVFTTSVTTDKEKGYVFSGDGIDGKHPGEIHINYTVNGQQYVFEIYYASREMRLYESTLTIDGQSRSTNIIASLFDNGVMWLKILGTEVPVSYTRDGKTYTITEGKYDGKVFTGSFDQNGLKLNGGLSFNCILPDYAQEIDGITYQGTLYEITATSRDSYSMDSRGGVGITISRTANNEVNIIISNNHIAPAPVTIPAVCWFSGYKPQYGNICMGSDNLKARFEKYESITYILEFTYNGKQYQFDSSNRF